MPYIKLSTSVSLDEKLEDALKSALGKAITDIPGKTESWLMVELEGDRKLWLGGKKRPLAMIDVKIFGKAEPEDFNAMTGTLCDVCQRVLGIKPDGVYVTYAEVPNWGWNGENF